MIFLVDYDRRSGQLLSISSFQDDQLEEAQNTRLQMELSLGSDKDSREIVLLDANDEDALRRTHRRYFENLSELAEVKQKTK